MAEIVIKRAYDDPADSDGARILVDAMWPRGISKEALEIDAWLKEIAPSKELRQWFGHDPDRWEEFRARYRDELDGRSRAAQDLKAHAQKGRLTLIYAAKDADHNNAVVLAEWLRELL